MRRLLESRRLCIGLAALLAGVVVASVDGSWIHRAFSLSSTASLCLLFVFSLASSQRKQAEGAAAAESEARLRSLFEGAPDGVVVFDAESGEIVLVSPVLTQILDRTPSELLGRPVTRRTLAAAKRAAAKEGPVVAFPFGEDRLRRRDGKEFFVESTGTFLEYQGRSCVLAFVRDITERRRVAKALEDQRALLRTILDNTDNGLLVLDAERRVVFYNEQYQRSFGVPRELIDAGATLDELIRWACRQGLYPEDRADELIADRLRELENSGGRRSIETPRQDGVVMEAYTTPLPGGGHLLAFRDVTDRERIEDALRAAKEFSERLVGSSPVATFVIDDEHRVLFWNGACEELTGLPASEVVGTRRHWSAFYASERPCLADLVVDGRQPDVERHYPEWGRSILAPEGLRAEGWYPRLGGLNRYIAFDAAPLRGGAGELLGAVETLQDISRRKRAEDSARHSLSLLRSTLESTADGILVVDRGGKVVLWNQRFQKMWGISESLLAGRDDAALLETVSGQLRAPADFLRDVAAVYARPETESFDMLECSDGRVFERYSIPQRLDGAAVGRVWSFRDVTARERATQELALLATAVEQAGEAIVVTDSAGLIQYVNPAFEQITGFAREEVSARPHALLSGEGRGEEPGELPSASMARGEAWKGKVVSRRKDGTRYEEETSVSPVRDAAGRVVNYVAVTRDVTVEVELQRRLSQGQKLEALGTLSGGIAHDFNNILAAIIGFTEMTRDDLPRGSRERDNLDRVIAAGKRARDVIRQILAFSRPSSEEREAIRVVPLLEETVGLLRASFPATIEIRRVLKTPEASVLADSSQIQQVLLNLFSNAGHAMAEKGGTLTIGLEELEEVADETASAPLPRRWVELTVSDTGPGIPADIRDRIFEPFFTTKDVGEGTGMGLSVVHGIVTSHGGSIAVESPDGSGATFRIRLPATEGVSEGAAEPSLLPALGQGRERLLFVDDEEDLVELAEQVLGQLGYQVVAVSDSIVALNLFRRDPAAFDLLITDQAMPGLNGWDLCREILSIRPGLPVLLCTGGDPSRWIERAQEADVPEVLLKPYNLTNLAVAICRALGREDGCAAPHDKE